MNNLTPARAARLRRLLARRLHKAKVSVTLSGELVQAADAVAGRAGRSAFVERAVRRYLRVLLRRARREHDLLAIAQQAEATNRESDAALEIQQWPG